MPSVQTKNESVAVDPPYQDFLSSWQDADADIPILKQAKAQCAKLQ